MEERKSRFTYQLAEIINNPQKEDPPEYPFCDSDDQDEGDALDVRMTTFNKKREAQTFDSKK